MPASEREAQSGSSQSGSSQSGSARSHARPQPPSVVSMRDLLASCAAATAVSTPPREPEQGQRQGPGRAAA
ncbi:hypothetical protein NLX86_17975 [Streptomyces sp. A3M-1-3]|nr:hypothetical protein [Streptomyces sp. A3M-1-3]MCP3819915.1 hypothetical protein [Streptomyces sp. A3M-1-3]